MIRPTRPKAAPTPQTRRSPPARWVFPRSKPLCSAAMPLIFGAGGQLQRSKIPGRHRFRRLASPIPPGPLPDRRRIRRPVANVTRRTARGLPGADGREGRRQAERRLLPSGDPARTRLGGLGERGERREAVCGVGENAGRELSSEARDPGERRGLAARGVPRLRQGARAADQGENRGTDRRDLVTRP